MMINRRQARPYGIGVTAVAWLLLAKATLAAPAGYVERTILLDAPPVGLAFDADGVLYALEGADFGSSTATLRTILPGGGFGDSFAVTGDDPDNFFVGAMAYDPVEDRLLISDNTGDGRLYAVDKTGNQQTIATGIAGIAGIAVSDAGEILVTTSPFGSAGEVRQVSRTGDSSTSVLGGLGFGAGLALDVLGNLYVQDAAATAPYRGRVRLIPNTTSGLDFNGATSIKDDMQSAAGIVVDGEGDVFTTGVGGLFLLAGSPLAETSFSANGNPSQFATAIAFDPGSEPFEPFAGPGGGRLAFMADYGFGMEDSFVTLLTPAHSADSNSDGSVDGSDLATWATHFGEPVTPELGDADADGDADGNDFLVWQRQLTGSPPLLTSEAWAASQIPEPRAWELIAVGAIILLGKSVMGSNVKRSDQPSAISDQPDQTSG